MTEALHALAETLQGRLGGDLERCEVANGEVTIEVAAAKLRAVCLALRDDEALAFEQLIDLCGVDYGAYGASEWDAETAPDTGFSRGVEAVGARPCRFSAAARFAVVIHLLSVRYNRRLRLRAFASDEALPRVDSVVDIWSAANWFEREAFDMYGILFEGHPDLRRLLTDYGFVGHPFRKDFPLSGHVEMRYDPEKGRVIYEPVSIEERTLVPRVIRDDHRYAGRDDEAGEEVREF